jgi:hypothetical protein
MAGIGAIVGGIAKSAAVSTIINESKARTAKFTGSNQSAINLAKTHAPVAIQTVGNFAGKVKSFCNKIESLVNPGSDTPLTDADRELVRSELRHIIDGVRLMCSVSDPPSAESTKGDIAELHKWGVNALKNLKENGESEVSAAFATTEMSFQTDGKKAIRSTISYDDLSDTLKGAAQYAYLTENQVNIERPNKAGSAGDTYTMAKVNQKKKDSLKKFLSLWDGGLDMSTLEHFSPDTVPWTQALNFNGSAAILNYLTNTLDSGLLVTTLQQSTGFVMDTSPFHVRNYSESVTVAMSGVADRAMDDNLVAGNWVVDTTTNLGCSHVFYFNGNDEIVLPGSTNLGSTHNPITDYFTRTRVLSHFLNVSISLQLAGDQASIAYPNRLASVNQHVLVVLFCRFPSDPANQANVVFVSGSSGGQTYGAVDQLDGPPVVNLKFNLDAILKEREVRGEDPLLWGNAFPYVDTSYVPNPAGEFFTSRLVGHCSIQSQSRGIIPCTNLSNYNEITYKWEDVDPAKSLQDYLGGVSSGADGEPSTTLYAYLNKHPGFPSFKFSMDMVRTKKVEALVKNYISVSGKTPTLQEISNIGWWFSGLDPDDTIRTAAVQKALRDDFTELLKTFSFASQAATFLKPSSGFDTSL